MGLFDSNSKTETSSVTRTTTDESITDLAGASGASVYNLDFAEAVLAGGAASFGKNATVGGGLGGGTTGELGGAGGAINVAITDSGAIRSSADLARAVVASQQGTQENFLSAAVELAKRAGDQAVSAGNSVMSAARELARPADAETIQRIAMYAALALVAAVVVWRVAK